MEVADLSPMGSKSESSSLSLDIILFIGYRLVVFYSESLSCGRISERLSMKFY